MRFEQRGYPRHEDDSGPLIPTTTGGLICGKCHRLFPSPDRPILEQARKMHASAGTDPVPLRKFQLNEMVPDDLTEAEQKSLRSCAAKRIRSLSEKAFGRLIDLGLAKVEKLFVKTGGVEDTRMLTEEGERLAKLCAAMPPPVAAQTVPMFDLGAPDPAFAHLKQRKRAG